MEDHRRNLELKVQCTEPDLLSLEGRLARRTGSPLQVIAQVDTYYRVAHGRLKVRTLTAAGDAPIDRAELIAYRRPTTPDSRWSSYEVIPVSASDAPALIRALDLTHDRLARVAKVRRVALLDHTRVHLDRVEGLGAFVELETVVTGQTDDDASREHAHVIDALGLARFTVVSGSYSDLMLETSGRKAVG